MEKQPGEAVSTLGLEEQAEEVSSNSRRTVALGEGPLDRSCEHR